MNYSKPPRGQWPGRTYELYLTLYVKDPPRGKEIVLEGFFNRLIHAYNCTRHDTTGFSPFFPDVWLFSAITGQLVV